MNICIDAGRGGKDAGRTAGKVTEKNIALSFSEILAKEFKRLKTEVLLTRQDDTDLEVSHRAAMAAKFNADVFITIHCNASEDKTARGVTVARYRPDSEPLAVAVAEQLKTESGFDDTPYLRFISMPGIIIRVGYLTSSHDLKKVLMDENHLQGMAKLIAEAAFGYVSANK